MVKLLLVEDDTVLGDGIQSALKQAGYSVDWVTSGLDADHLLAMASHDVVVLDLGLPGLDGLAVLRRSRERKERVPILILTAREALADRVQGLDLGADDYLTKPFDLPELEARLRALIRRRQGGMAYISVQDVHFDLNARRVYIQTQAVSLSSREISLLECLLMRLGQVVSKEQLLDHLYGLDEEAGENAIEVYIHRLRKKLEPGGLRIRTIRGLGYLVEKEGPPVLTEETTSETSVE